MKYLSFKELSDGLGGRSRSSIYRDVEAGRLPQPMKIGHRLFWKETEVEAYLASCRLEFASQAAPRTS